MKDLEITVSDYFKMDVTLHIDTLLDSLEPFNGFLGSQFNVSGCSYSDVRKIVKLTHTGSTLGDLLNLFKLSFRCSENDFLRANIVEFIRALRFLTLKVSDIIKNESELLRSDIDDKDRFLWDEAGGKELDVFSDILPLDRLCKLYGGYPYDLMKRPYNEVLVLLALNAKENNIAKKFNELKNKLNG